MDFSLTIQAIVEKYEQNFNAIIDTFDVRFPSIKNVFVIESFSLVRKIFLRTFQNLGWFGSEVNSRSKD